MVMSRRSTACGSVNLWIGLFSVIQKTSQGAFRGVQNLCVAELLPAQPVYVWPLPRTAYKPNTIYNNMQCSCFPSIPVLCAPERLQLCHKKQQEHVTPPMLKVEHVDTKRITV